jgi:hypothetical protein
MQKRNAKTHCSVGRVNDTLMTGGSATKKKPSTRHHVVAEEVANGHVGLSVDVVDWIG